MKQRPAAFFSNGTQIDADLYLPSNLAPGDTRPALVTCSGYQGLKIIHPARFSRAFVPHGYVCLAFDYRGFGKSEGERGRLVPQEQVEDLRAAISFLETVPEVDVARIVIIGWGLGGGVAIVEAADDPRVGAVAAINPVGDGERSTRFMHDRESWGRLIERIGDDRRRQAEEGRSELVHPFEIVRLDRVTNSYVDEELYKAPGFGSAVTLQSADFLLRFRPEEVVARIAPRPLLLIHGAHNQLHSPEESRELHRRAGPATEIVLLEGQGHTEWMYDDHPTFIRVVETLRAFFAKSIYSGAAGPLWH